jgi:putative flippase GtrA
MREEDTMGTESFLKHKRKFLLAVLGTITGAGLMIYMIHAGVPAREAAEITAIALASLWGFIAVEGGRDVVRTWRNPEDK